MPTVSRTVVLLAGAMASLHLMNFLNYSSIRYFADFPLIRAGLLITLTAILVLSSSRHVFGYHLTRNWDIYAFCLICFATIAVSIEPGETLKYSIWLLLSCYAGLELGRQVKTFQELQTALLIVVAPATLASLAAYVTVGPATQATGRVFGGLGTAHVDVTLVLDFSLLLLAIYSLKAERVAVPRLIRLLALPLIPYSAYLIVFGLTRSVWLSFTLGLFLFLATSVKRAVIAAFAVLVATLIIDVAGLAPIGLVPDAVKGRIEVTEKRADAGEIDPRLRGWRVALETVTERPEGYGYGAGAKTHNTYFDILVATGVAGFTVMLFVILRSARLCSRMPPHYYRFFLIGSAPLLVHAIFEMQSTPGQANFIPLLTWLAMTRSTFVTSLAKKRAMSSLKARDPINATLGSRRPHLR